MVKSEVLLDLIEVFEILEDSIFEDRVELVLDLREDGGGLERVDALRAEGLLPVEALKVVDAEPMEYVHDACDDFGLI